MTESKIARAEYLKTTIVSGTTDSSGNLRLTAPSAVNAILYVSDGNKVFIPFFYNGSWYARVQATNGTVLTNTAVTAQMLYF